MTTTATKGNFSQAPADVLAKAIGKNYVAVHVEQGVPVLDRDLNLMADLNVAALRRALQVHVGNGVPGATDFQIVSNEQANDFQITAGSCVVNGIEVTLAATIAYSAQLATAQVTPLPLTTPTATDANPRIDTVYLDVWQVEIDDSPLKTTSGVPLGDPTLSNPSDVGIRTSTRIQTGSVVNVSQGQPLPTAPSGHFYCALAQLSRPTGAAIPGGGSPSNNTIVDLRQTGLALPSIVARIAAIETVLQPYVTDIKPQTVTSTTPLIITGGNFVLGAKTASVAFQQGSTLIAAVVSGDPVPTSNTIGINAPPPFAPGGNNTYAVVVTLVGSGVSAKTFTVSS